MASINLTTTPERIAFPATHFVYLETHGPFAEKAPRAWQDFWGIIQPGPNATLDMGLITSMVGLGHIDHSKQGDAAFIYQAGVLVREKPNTIPHGLQHRIIDAGTYARFLLTGAYKQLADAYPMAFDILGRNAFQIRDDFCIERYLNTPQDVPEDQLQTEILIPVV